MPVPFYNVGANPYELEDQRAAYEAQLQMIRDAAAMQRQQADIEAQRQLEGNRAASQQEIAMRQISANRERDMNQAEADRQAREMQGSQYDRSSSQRESEFGRSLSQRESEFSRTNKTQSGRDEEDETYWNNVPADDYIDDNNDYSNNESGVEDRNDWGYITTPNWNSEYGDFNYEKGKFLA